MGQRHQIFVIARIPSAMTSCYRCIAAVHVQLLWGREPLAVCSSFIALVKNKDNALIVEAELGAIEAAYSPSIRSVLRHLRRSYHPCYPSLW
ncbi:hypothetical protein JB92DRAFT_124138 [Gautieria morchelliformis]|nr:hypothetical protein JB92DRAFT_124138 [Gautieria morchelliformis]